MEFLGRFGKNLVLSTVCVVTLLATTTLVAASVVVGAKLGEDINNNILSGGNSDTNIEG